MYHLTERITHTTAFVIPDVEHWLELEILLYNGSSHRFLLVDPLTISHTIQCSTIGLKKANVRTLVFF